MLTGMTEAWHGTTGGHSNHQCKCHACREAWNAYCRIYRQARRAIGICMQCAQPATPYARCDEHRLTHNAKMRMRARARHPVT